MRLCKTLSRKGRVLSSVAAADHRGVGSHPLVITAMGAVLVPIVLGYTALAHYYKGPHMLGIKCTLRCI